MRFAIDLWHFPGAFFLVAMLAIGGVFGAIFLFQGRAERRARERFGDTELVHRLATFDPMPRRWIKATLLLFALLAFFAALARPQIQKGMKRIPGSNLDVVIALDYSKSMYARDFRPNRIARAKAEVTALVRALRGARFGAVAFAGEPIAFPLTSDGASVSEFFHQLEPNDMPVGGTAIARALEKARALLTRDEHGKDHIRIVMLITDGEDLEGDPAKVAAKMAEDGITIHVVQIGGRSPEVIPDVEQGKVVGIRRDESGKPLTTSLSSQGEADLEKIASVTSGKLVRSHEGQTGIAEITKDLVQRMREEGEERIEIDWADAHRYPLGLALLLLLVEAFVFEAKRRSHLPPVWRRLFAFLAGRAAPPAHSDARVPPHPRHPQPASPPRVRPHLPLSPDFGGEGRKRER